MSVDMLYLSGELNVTLITMPGNSEFGVDVVGAGLTALVQS